MSEKIKSMLKRNDVPHLNEGVDFTQIKLNPKEGFVLSRVDGNTTLEEIASICGIQFDEVLTVFSKLVVHNAVRFKERELKKERPLSKEKLSIIEQLDQDDKSEDFKNISREKRKMILLAEQDLDKKNYYEVLGLKKSALDSQIKRAYFQMTKDFHPDRFFGKKLGIYKKKLESVFAKITEAYEILSDPVSKKQYDIKTFPSKFAGKEKEKPADKKPGAPKTLIEKLADAKKYYELGEAEFKTGNVVSASSYFKLAISFDPKNQLYQRAIEKTRPALNKKRAKAKFEEAIKKNDFGNPEAALELLCEAIELDPHVPDYNYNLAKLLFHHKRDYVKSKELCLKAVEHMGDKAEVRVTMGQIYRAAGLAKNAIREFKLALKLDKENQTAKMELEELE